MEVGDLVSEQFKILSVAGVGGMGKVFRALDTKSNTEVALKLLTLDPSKYSRRFMREAKVMSRLQHKNIIEYLGYGQTTSGAPYIVMEWVLGEDLRQRMNRKAISLDEALAIIKGLGDALALADKQGVIHRDLKPSNLMLVDGKVDVIKLLDFGIARGSDPDLERMTKTGVSIGTPGYMAPEQSRGESKIDGRADLYALGCVVYETLVGQRPFRGEDIVSVLARGAIEEPPRVSAHRTDISQAFDDLLAEMMAFRPDQRPINGSVAAKRAAVIPSTRTKRAAPSQSSSDFGHSEKEPTGIILSKVDLRPHDLLVAECFEKTEHTVEHFDNGSSVILLHTPGKSTQELMYLCADHSLALQQRLPETSFFLRVEFADWKDPRMPRNAMNSAVVARTDLAPLPGVELDQIVARSVCERFHVIKYLNSETTRYRLGPVHQDSAASFQHQHEILGQTSDLVGREKESSWLSSIFSQSITESSLKIALLSGSAGMGKTRIREWFTDEICVSHPNARFWYARCISPSTPYKLIGALVSQASGHRKSDSRSERREKLHSLVSGAVAPERVDHICEFIGELCNTSFVADSSRSILLAARGNPAMMRNQVLGAWRELFSALAGTTPLVLIVEDLQFIDTESHQALGSVLLSSSDRPLTLLALSQLQHNSLWSELDVERHTLDELSGEESQIFAQALSTAGHALTPDLLQQAKGNPASIEELALHANQSDTTTPLSILLRCYNEVSPLSKQHKRFLCAASILGQESPLSCISYLLGETNVANHDSVLTELIQRRIITSNKDDSGARRIAFENDFTRRAVYASLNAKDKVLGHRRTADWISESWVNRSADLPLDVSLSLAYHQVQSNQSELAVANYCHAAKLELQATHILPAINIATKALRLPSQETQQFLLQSLLATAYLWAGRNDLASEYGANALESTSTSSELWSRTSADTAIALMRCGATMDMQSTLDALLASDSTVAPDGFLQSIARSLTSLCQMGRFADTGPLVKCLAPHWESDKVENVSKESQGHMAIALAHRDLGLGQPESHFLNIQRAIQLFGDTSQIEARISAHIALGCAHAKLGEWTQAESSLRDTLESSIGHRLPFATAECHLRLGQIHIATGNYDEAREQLNHALRLFSRQKNEGQEHRSRVYLSQTYQLAGLLDTAEELVRQALGGTSTMAQVRMLANAQLASILTVQGRAEEALTCARESYEILSLLKPVPEGRVLVSLSFIEALFLCEHNERAIMALKAAHGDLLGSTNYIKDPSRKLSYVEQVPENARLVSLAIKWNIDKEMVSQ